MDDYHLHSDEDSEDLENINLNGDAFEHIQRNCRVAPSSISFDFWNAQ